MSVNVLEIMYQQCVGIFCFFFFFLYYCHKNHLHCHTHIVIKVNTFYDEIFFITVSCKAPLFGYILMNYLKKREEEIQ